MVEFAQDVYQPPTDTVSIDPNQPDAIETVSLNNSAGTLPVTSEIAVKRASRAHFGLNNVIPKTWDEYYQPIKAGQEDLLRTDVANQIDMQKNVKLHQTITGIANQVEGPLTPEDYAKIQQTITGNKPTNPLTVFEENFANKYIGHVYENNDPTSGSWVNESLNYIPSQVQVADQKATLLQTFYEKLRGFAEEAEENYRGQGWLPWGMDQTRNLFQVYVEAEMRNNVEGARFAWGLGNTLNNQADALLQSKSVEEFMAKITPIMAHFAKYNPTLGVQWINAMIGQSMSDRVMNNLFTAIAIPDYYSLAKLGLGAGIGSTRMLARRIILYNDTQDLKKGMIQASANAQVRPLNVTAADAVGNMEAAGIHQVNADVAATIRGNLDPRQQAMQQLTSGMNVMGPQIAASPGRFGQSTATMLLDYLGNASHTLSTVIDNMLSVNRIPGVLASETVLQRAWNDIKTNWRGVDNAILDIDRPAVRIQNVGTTTYHYDYRIGNSDGSMFESRDHLRNNANLNGMLIRSTEEELNRKLLASQYKNYNEYREAVRKAGQPPSQRAFKKGAEFDEARATKISAEGYGVGEAPMPAPKGKWIIDKYKNFNEYRNDMRSQGIKDTNLQVKGSMEFNKLQTEIKKATAMADARRASGVAETHQYGTGYYIKYTTPLTETQDIVRDGLVKLANAQQPEFGLAKSLIARYRTPEEILSVNENIQRKVAVHGPSILIRAAREIVAEPLGSLPRRYKRDFNRMLEAMQHEKGPDGIPGKFHTTPLELETWYRQHLKRPPEEAEIKAYWGWRAQVEFDHAMRDIQEYTLRSRWGAQSHNITLYAKGSTTEKVSTGFVDGRELKTVPGGSNDIILYMGLNEGNEKFYRTHQLGKNREKWQKALDEGKIRIIEPWNNELRSYAGFGKVTTEKVRYVIAPTSSFETKPLSFDQVARRGGGHLVPDYDHYLSQAKIHESKVGGVTTHTYEGDANVMPIKFRRMGQDVADKMNVVRELLAAGKTDEARAYNSANLPFKWTDNGNGHYDWYQPSKDPKGRPIAPRFNLTEPFQVRPKNKNLIDVPGSGIEARYKDTFENGTKTGNPARVHQVEYTGARDHYDLYTITNKGSAKNPLYTYQPAEYVDPITIMNRSLNRIINSTYMTDMKIYSVEHWLQNAIEREVLKPLPDEIRSSPLWYFHQGPKIFKDAISTEDKLQFTASHRMIMDFLGQPNIVSNHAQALRQKMVDSIYNKSPKWAMIADEKLPGARDPIAAARTFTYHLKLGLFAVPQFFTQLTTFSNVLAISPRHAPAAAYATLIHSWASVNSHLPFLASMDLKAARFGWRPGELMEAMTELRRSGFVNVGHEHALLDSPLNINVVQSGANKVLSYGETPFRLGAQFVRASSYYTAYREFRLGSSTKLFGEDWKGTTRALTDDDRRLILSRAALLDHNMSRAASSLLHTGVMAPFGQFKAYQMRLTEMFTGKRLTRMEKARLFGISSVLYGLPAGGLGLLAFPGEEYLRQKAHELGYVVGSNYFTDFLGEGLPATILAAGTGVHANIRKFGLKDELIPLHADKPFLEMFLGASGGTFFSMFKRMDPILAWASALVEGKSYPLGVADMVDFAREIRTVNSGWTGFQAATTHQWMDRNRKVVKDNVGAISSILMAVTGTSPSDVADVHGLRGSIKAREEYHKYVEQRFTRDFQQMLRISQTDPTNTTALDFYGRRVAVSIAHVPYEERGKLYAQAAEGLEPDVDRLPKQWLLKHLDPVDASWWSQFFQGRLKPNTSTPLEQLDTIRKNK